MNWNDKKLAGPLPLGDLIRQPAGAACIYDVLPGADMQATQQRVGMTARRAGGNVSVSLILGFERNEPRRFLRVVVTAQAAPKQKRGPKPCNGQ